MGQRKLSSVQCLKNSIPPSINSTQSSRQLFPLYFNDIQLSLSFTMNILGLSFTHNLKRKLHISFAKTAFMMLGVLRRLSQLFSSPQLLTLYKGLVRPRTIYVEGGDSTHTALLYRVESKAFRLINPSSLTDCLQPLSLPECCISCYFVSLFSC